MRNKTHQRMSNTICNGVFSGPSKDLALNNGRISRFTSNSAKICNLRSDNADIDNLSVNNLFLNNVNIEEALQLDLFVNGDIGQSQFVNNELTLPGTGGIQTQAIGADTLQITDLRNLTPFVVSQNVIPDNPGEYSTITAALDAAETAISGTFNFAVVYVKEGFYVEDFTMRDRVFLVGLGNSGISGTITITPASSTISQAIIDRINFVSNGVAPNIIIDGDGGVARAIFQNCSISVSSTVEGVVATDSNGGAVQVTFINSQISAPTVAVPTNALRFEGLNGTSFLNFFGRSVLNGIIFINNTSPLTEVTLTSIYLGNFILEMPATNVCIVNMISVANESEILWSVPQYQIGGGVLNMSGCYLVRGEFVVSGNNTRVVMTGSNWENSQADTPIEITGTNCVVELVGNNIRHPSGGAGVINVGDNNIIRAIGNIFSHGKTNFIVGGGVYDQPINGGGPAGNYVVSGSSTITSGINAILMV